MVMKCCAPANDRSGDEARVLPVSMSSNGASEGESDSVQRPSSMRSLLSSDCRHGEPQGELSLIAPLSDDW